ncbi:MAG TPA: SDR family oxidoreductase [Polyangia bacterium]|nr:SDR family oxidoreductase [Polyangia bacterium]
MESSNLKGTAALVTGASRGLGAALARRLGRAGARLALVARGGEALEAVAREIRAAGGEAHAVPGDVGDKRDAHRIAGAAAALVGPLEVVVHNASTLGATPLVPLLETDCEDLERALAVNLVGPFRLTKIVAGAMAARGRGLVVHVSSDAAVAAYPRWGAYGVSKAAQDHLGRILAAELEGTGVRVVSVDPGEMNTRMHAEAIPDADPAALADPDAVAARLVALIARPALVASGGRVELERLSEPAAEGRP